MTVPGHEPTILALTGLAKLLIWGGVLIALLVVAGSFWALLRRRLLGREETKRPGAFDVAELEALRRGGQISQEEFRTLRRAALGLGAAGPPKPGGSSPGPAEDDEPKSEAADDEPRDREDH